MSKLVCPCIREQPTTGKLWLIRHAVGVGSALTLMILTGCNAGLSCLPCTVANDGAVKLTMPSPSGQRKPMKISLSTRCDAALYGGCTAGRPAPCGPDGSMAARVCCAQLLDAGDLSTDGTCQ